MSDDTYIWSDYRGHLHLHARKPGHAYSLCGIDAAQWIGDCPKKDFPRCSHCCAIALGQYAPSAPNPVLETLRALLPYVLDKYDPKSAPAGERMIVEQARRIVNPDEPIRFEGTIACLGYSQSIVIEPDQPIPHRGEMLGHRCTVEIHPK